MTTFALIHGSGDGGWAWHLVEKALQDRGHDTVAPDLPTDRDDATWDDCIAAVVNALGTADDVVVVGHSAGGLLVPLVADRLGAKLQVFVVGLVPKPGETAGEWFGNVGWSEAVADQARADGGLTGNDDPLVSFYNDVPEELATQALGRERAVGMGDYPWPLDTLPPIPAKFIVTTQDRFVPPAVQRRVAAERLGITEPDELDTGHCANLGRPVELAKLLAGYVS